MISAAIATNRGLTLHGVSVFIFDNEGHFVERVDGKRADLHEGYWEIKDAWVVRIGREPEKFDTYLVSTYLTPERVTDALGTVFSVSFWEMPGLIEVAEKAKLSSDRLRIQYEAAAVAAVALRGDGPFGRHCVAAVIPRRRHPDYGHYWNGWGVRLLSSGRSLPANRCGWIGAALGGGLVARGPALCLSRLTVLLHQEDG